MEGGVVSVLDEAVVEPLRLLTSVEVVCSDAQEMAEKLSESLLQEARDNGFITKSSKATRLSIKHIVLNVALIKGGWLSIPAHADYYNKGNALKDMFGLSKRATDNVIASLYKLGYITHLKGDRKHTQKIKATNRLLGVVSGINVELPVEAFIILDVGESRSVHGVHYKPFNNRKAEETYQQNLYELNKLNKNQSWKLGGHLIPYHQLAFRAVYKNTYKEQGRWYASFQNRLKYQRVLIGCNDVPCVELDIKASYIQIAYAKAGIDFTSLGHDPYSINGLTCDKRGSHEEQINRELCKIALLSRFRTKTMSGAVKATVKSIMEGLEIGSLPKGCLTSVVKQLFQFDTEEHDTAYKKAKLIVEGVSARNAAISSEFGKVANTYMNMEANMIHDVVGKLMALKIPCLLMHDSIIVPVDRANEASYFLVWGIQKHYGMAYENAGQCITETHFERNEESPGELAAVMAKGFEERDRKMAARAHLESTGSLPEGWQYDDEGYLSEVGSVEVEASGFDNREELEQKLIEEEQEREYDEYLRGL